MKEKTVKIKDHETDLTSVDLKLEQLVHVISTKFNGDTVAFFNSIAAKPDNSRALMDECGAVRSFLKSSRQEGL